jgi:hypothetical protein
MSPAISASEFSKQLSKLLNTSVQYPFLLSGNSSVQIVQFTFPDAVTQERAFNVAEANKQELGFYSAAMMESNETSSPPSCSPAPSPNLVPVIAGCAGGVVFILLIVLAYFVKKSRRSQQYTGSLTSHSLGDLVHHDGRYEDV